MITAARRALLCACFTILTSTIAHAAVLTVDDDNVQCAGASFTTITSALVAASPTGDTIQACDGTYAEGTIVVSKEVIIDGVNRDATLINVIASGTFGFHVQADKVTISDLVIQEIGGAAVTSANAIRYTSLTPLDNEVVSNVVIRDFEGGSARGIEVDDATLNDISITNSTFTNNLTGMRMSSNSDVDGLLLTGSTFSATATRTTSPGSASIRPTRATRPRSAIFRPPGTRSPTCRWLESSSRRFGTLSSHRTSSPGTTRASSSTSVI